MPQRKRATTRTLRPSKRVAFRLGCRGAAETLQDNARNTDEGAVQPRAGGMRALNSASSALELGPNASHALPRWLKLQPQAANEVRNSCRKAWTQFQLWRGIFKARGWSW